MAVAHRVYAQALIEAAGSDEELAAVRPEFAEFAAAVEESQELREFLRNPQIQSRTKRDALDALLADAQETLRKFVLLLAEKERVGEVEQIHAEFERILAARERALELHLVTAVELTDEEAERILRRIQEAAGRRVTATRAVDPSLLGGIIVQADSVRVDASVRGRLERLREELVTST